MLSYKNKQNNQEVTTPLKKEMIWKEGQYIIKTSY